MRALFLEANRDGYSPRQCGETLTVAELTAWLENFPDEMPIFLRHDNGFTYGAITEDSFQERTVKEDDD